jgi:ABC-type spermidine/putrescine transport system permease subunit II
MGPPRDVAASYYPAGQYVVGPELYPAFLTTMKIAFTSIVGVQLVAIIASLGASGTFSPLDEIGNLLDTLPMVLGWVVLVFWLLQRGNVQPDAEGPFDPRKLPARSKRALSR